MLKYKRKEYQIIYDSNCFYNIIQPKRVVVNTIAACLKMLEMFINEHLGKLDFFCSLSNKTPLCHSEERRQPRRGNLIDVIKKRLPRLKRKSTYKKRKLKFRRENYETQRTTRTNIRAFKK